MENKISRSMLTSSNFVLKCLKFPDFSPTFFFFFSKFLWLKIKISWLFPDMDFFFNFPDIFLTAATLVKRSNVRFESHVADSPNPSLLAYATCSKIYIYCRTVEPHSMKNVCTCSLSPCADPEVEQGVRIPHRKPQVAIGFLRITVTDPTREAIGPMPYQHSKIVVFIKTSYTFTQCPKFKPLTSEHVALQTIYNLEISLQSIFTFSKQSFTESFQFCNRS